MGGFDSRETIGEYNMGGLANFFGFGNMAFQNGDMPEIPDIFPLSITESAFVKIDVETIYSKILTDVVERTNGLNEDHIATLWDNCLKSSTSDGLITMLARSMADKRDLYLVYEQALKLLRKATDEEAKQIKADYEKTGESKIGIYVSFNTHHKSDMVKIYSALQYSTVGALAKSMNLSKAVQIKIDSLRGAVALTDSSIAISQAAQMADALTKGRGILCDAKDIIETAKPDLTATQAAVEFLNQKLSFYLGMPESYINGEQTGGIGTTGENDMRAVERGLKSYYFSIIKPVVEALFSVTVTYKSQDFRQVEQAMDVLKTFSLTDEQLLSQENKLLIINRLLDLPEDAVGDPAKAPEPVLIKEGQKFAIPPSNGKT